MCVHLVVYWLIHHFFVWHKHRTYSLKYSLLDFRSYCIEVVYERLWKIVDSLRGLKHWWSSFLFKCDYSYWWLSSCLWSNKVFFYLLLHSYIDWIRFESFDRSLILLALNFYDLLNFMFFVVTKRWESYTPLSLTSFHIRLKPLVTRERMLIASGVILTEEFNDEMSDIFWLSSFSSLSSNSLD